MGESEPAGADAVIDVPRIRLADVAEAAGVSLKTASRVLNGEPYVAAETRARVEAAAARLAFQPNQQASMLARGVASAETALIVGDILNPFYAGLAKGLEGVLRERELYLTLASSDEGGDEERRLIERFVRRRVRGIALVSALADHASLADVRGRGVSLVFVDRPPVGMDADSVVLDNAGGARAATEQLLALGHRRIAFVGDYDRVQTHRERARGFGEAMTAAGVSGWRAGVHSGAHGSDAARRVVSGLLAADDRPTAVIAGNNRVAIGAIEAIAAVHPSTALIGFDDFELAGPLGVTTVSHDPVRMGRAVGELLLHPATGPARELVLPTALVPRGSGERAPAR